jgi:hypothetical protein
MAQGTRIQILGNGAGTNIINTMFLMESIPTQDWPALADKVKLKWCSSFSASFQGSIFRWTGVQISWLSPNGPTPQSFAFNVIGGNNSLLPMQVAFVIKLITGISGRSFNGKWYISGLAPVIVSNGFPATAYLDTMATKLAQIKADWTLNVGAPHTLAVYSRKRDQLSPVINLAVSPVFGTIRSRRFGVGI